MRYLSALPGRAYLLIAVVIFAASNSVTRQLIDIGAQNPINGHNPVSFCNVLFVGNICAIALLLPIYHRELSRDRLSQLTGKDWVGLLLVALLSGALAPALIFTALDQTSVNNVILISRIEPPLALALSVMFLGERVNRWVVAGAAIAFVGVALTVLLQPVTDGMMSMGGVQIGQGDLLVAGGAIASAIATIISKISLRDTSLGLFTLVRTTVGTVFFFVAVLVLFDLAHFAEVFTPFLWQWMLIYGAIIVVGGQLAWFAGLQKSRAAEVSLANSFNPIAGILAAFLILGDVPTPSQMIGGIVILIGIGANQMGIRQPARSPQPSPQLKEMDLEAGYKGL
jgi:drug/metabolite transporter (DMT)-like permease